MYGGGGSGYFDDELCPIYKRAKQSIARADKLDKLAQRMRQCLSLHDYAKERFIAMREEMDSGKDCINNQWGNQMAKTTKKKPAAKKPAVKSKPKAKAKGKK